MGVLSSQPRSVVIPYYNEMQRFPIENFFGQILMHPETNFILVDDGSEDNLTPIIRDYANKMRIENVVIIELSTNFGKGYALREGMRIGVQNGSKVLAFLDADFSTSLEELFRLIEILENAQVDAVIGSRVSNQTNVIEAKFYRLFLGKIFSAFTRKYLEIELRDTQCGAKVFDVNNVLRKSLQQEVIDPWLYDLQLLVPIIRSGGSILEIELDFWSNQGDSKFNVVQGARSVFKIRKIQKSFEYLKSGP